MERHHVCHQALAAYLETLTFRSWIFKPRGDSPQQYW
jgi:hypothetical protein